MTNDEQIMRAFLDLVDRYQRWRVDAANFVAEPRALFTTEEASPAACCCATLDEDLRPCEPCWLRLSPVAREGAR